MGKLITGRTKTTGERGGKGKPISWTKRNSYESRKWRSLGRGEWSRLRRASFLKNMTILSKFIT